MNINAAIVDQQLNRLVDEIGPRIVAEFSFNDLQRQKSLSFVFLCAKTLLNLNEDEAFETLTDGGNDFGVDALHIGEVLDGEFVVTIFQAKYSFKTDFIGEGNFPESGIVSAVGAVRHLFDPFSQLVANKKLEPKVAEVRSLISDGLIPQVRVVLCSNGIRWNAIAEDHITRFGNQSQVTWEHVNHDTLLTIMQSTKPVTDSLRLTGKAVVEDFEFSRVLVGKASVQEIAALINRNGDRLLERNIRRYLGLSGNRVNEAIQETLTRIDERSNFYFYNNGITIACSNFEYNGLQSADYQVNIKDLQIINGGQTSNTIHRVLADLNGANLQNMDKAFVMVRIYQLSSQNETFVQNITYATNSQNPVDLRDLKSNDSTQIRLEKDIGLLGYTYRRKRSDVISSRSEEITSGTAAEAVLSVWGQKPHQAKFFAREHFGKLYKDIFTNDLTGAQVVAATLLYRIAENKRRRPEDNAPAFVPYASCFLAMRMGEYLMSDLLDKNGRKVDLIDHIYFEKARSMIVDNGEIYYRASIKDIGEAIRKVYGAEEPKLPRLAATFRRGDLIEELRAIPLSTKLSITSESPAAA
ncbi:AIPR family protein [Sphingomonas sp. NCPPB 2930]